MNHGCLGQQHDSSRWLWWLREQRHTCFAMLEHEAKISEMVAMTENLLPYLAFFEHKMPEFSTLQFGNFLRGLPRMT